MPRHNNSSASLYSENRTLIGNYPKGQLRALIGTNEVVELCRNCGCNKNNPSERCFGKVKAHSFVFMATRLYGNKTHISSATLTLSDTLANVGCSRKSERDFGGISAGREKAAQLKVKLWPFIGDHKAVRVCPA